MSATPEPEEDGFDKRLRQRVAAKRDPLDTVPPDPAHQPRGLIPNTPLSVSLISFLLGSLFSFGLLLFVTNGYGLYWWATYQLGFFLAIWSAFHWAEFAVTAGWNRDKCSVDSFLLENGAMYHVAHSVALIEYLLTLYFEPGYKQWPYVSLVGIALVLVGQTLRSTAMIHAGSNFSHMLAYRKIDGHTLVTGGVYRWLRHPSYAGFLYWALGTQLVLQNPVSFAFFLVVLWRFFHSRIKTEEQYLIRFFGDDYRTYKCSVGTMIPFIP
ncbi:protein-s-isoprenylcysteine O-methyltransferase [Dichomitus squalens]|uniref:Protein-S-isoprenylcysteine O-methyltransferase n=2 Tax=Dichomitus squalens TaxID=114155 RepID=A0A4Q9P6R2_9APHY|nr:protein-s-isoprenylcysteine O-methyltransferase [Dichomitus squalens LYAD-421 SS1]EJF61178.1 protein-s-isoprenylcysteine O-methyltransferase [Dichomitus squalens LYAD-421 SS1]TBU49435.1 protein-s-isoprenylcysteine O-methyltransferase [Dichomitus squalens]TBU63964.1 protein-s-isoprenylcysteine O-methyltransferase [Dichomitus squalens]